MALAYCLNAGHQDLCIFHSFDFQGYRSVNDSILNLCAWRLPLCLPCRALDCSLYGRVHCGQNGHCAHLRHPHLMPLIR